MEPRQPDGPDSGATSAGPVKRMPPHASEATRLLCAGTYVDETYRRTVIDELYLHEERIVAPSFGFDAARVLAHALRAQRMELGWAVAILLLWIVSLPVTDGLSLTFLVPVTLMAIATRVRGTDPRPAGYRIFLSGVLRLYAWLAAFFNLSMVFSVLTLSNELFQPSFFWKLVLFPWLLSNDDLQPVDGWLALTVPVLGALAAALQRIQVSRALTGELSRPRFSDAAADPAERTAEGSRLNRLRERIRAEQHAPLVMYRADRPFRGAGTPYDTWSLSVELRPRPKEHPHDPDPVPLDNRTVLDRIVPLLEALRVPAARTAHGASLVRDRLRQLEIDECVFLPVDGLLRRKHAPYGPERFEEHKARAVEEGGEARRHFLRVRVGGWGEELVTTVLVRVHTQGGMLVLEVAPHVLRTIRPLFRDADRQTHDFLHTSPIGKAGWALSQVSRSVGRSAVSVWWALGLGWRLWTGAYGRALPDGPAVSVRELGSDDEAAVFQEMDHRRYLNTIQHRVANGVRKALYEAGWRTDEFEQKIINVSNGGVLIETAGAVGVGDHNIVSNEVPRTGSGGADSDNG